MLLSNPGASALIGLLKTLGEGPIGEGAEKVWKLQYFSAQFGNFIFFLHTIIQILCEINFGESISSKTAVFAFFEGLNFVHLVNFSL